MKEKKNKIIVTIVLLIILALLIISLFIIKTKPKQNLDNEPLFTNSHLLETAFENEKETQSNNIIYNIDF